MATLKTLSSLFCLIAMSCQHNEIAKNINSNLAPTIPQKSTSITLHGDTRVDNYAWVKNLNIMLGKEEPSPELMAVILEQNKYTDYILKPTEGLAETLKKELAQRKTDRNAAKIVPYKIGQFEYWKETKGTDIAFKFYRKKINTKNVELLIDGPALAGKNPFISIEIGEISPLGTYLPYIVDFDGDRQGALYVKNMNTMEVLKIRNDGVKGNSTQHIGWSADEKYVFYTVPGTVNRDSRIVKTDITTQPFNEKTVHDELDADFFVYIQNSASKKYIFIKSEGHHVTVYRAIKTENHDEPMIQFSTKRLGHEYFVDHADDKFIIRSNKLNDEFSLWTTDISNPSEEHWKQLKTKSAIPVPFNLKVFNKYVFVSGNSNGQNNAAIISLNDNSVYRIPKPDIMSYIEPEDNYDSKATVIRYSEWSPLFPKKMFEFNMKTHSKKLLSETKLTNYNPKNYEITTKKFPSVDGALIQTYIIKKKSLRNKMTPVFTDIYGHYGNNDINWWKYTGEYGQDSISLLERGVAVVVALVRGGGDISIEWRKAGDLKNKLKTLEDTVAVLNGLAIEKISSPDQIVFRGYSAGGINAGYVATHAPKSVKAIVARVPFVDVINTMTDVKIPLTTQEFNVWGNPITSATDYALMKSYAPYENTPDQEYPAIYAHISLHDSQVPYWEPLKWIAKLREHQTGNQPLLIDIQTEGSHNGGAGDADIKLNAKEQAFILNQMGINQ